MSGVLSAVAVPTRSLEAARFEAVYRAHIDFVWRNVQRLGIPEGHAEDVVQAVLLVVFRRLDAFEGRSSLKTWIYEIVVRVVRDHRRTLRRKSPYAVGAGPLDPAALPAPSEQRPDALADRAEAARIVRELLDQLDDAKREVFVLAELEQLTLGEIAEVLHERPGTIASRLRAARALRGGRETTAPVRRVDAATHPARKPGHGDRAHGIDCASSERDVRWPLEVVRLPRGRGSKLRGARRDGSACRFPSSSALLAFRRRRSPRRRGRPGDDTANDDGAHDDTARDDGAHDDDAHVGRRTPHAGSDEPVVPPVSSVEADLSGVTSPQLSRTAAPRPARAVRPPPIPRTPDALAAEARLVASAQAALDAREPARAFALLDERDRRFPSGLLNPETDALRVDALCATGRLEEARAAAIRSGIARVCAAGP